MCILGQIAKVETKTHFQACRRRALLLCSGYELKLLGGDGTLVHFDFVQLVDLFNSGYGKGLRENLRSFRHRFAAQLERRKCLMDFSGYNSHWIAADLADIILFLALLFYQCGSMETIASLVYRSQYFVHPVIVVLALQSNAYCWVQNFAYALGNSSSVDHVGPTAEPLMRGPLMKPIADNLETSELISSLTCSAKEESALKSCVVSGSGSVG